MITAEKVRIYKYCKGQIDVWARIQMHPSRSDLKDADWFDIGEIVERLTLERSAPMTEQFRADTAKMIADLVVDAEALALLNEMEGTFSSGLAQMKKRNG